MIDLERRRDVGEILRDAVALWAARWRTFLVIAIVVVVPIELIIFGIGLGELTDHYDADVSTRMLLLEVGVSWLLTTPLLTAMTIRALVEPERGAREAIVRGMELFVPALAVTIVATAAVIGGLFLLVLPGIFLAVRLAFVVEAVAVDDVRGAEALRRSWDLTSANFWRVLGITLLIMFLASAASQLVLLPFTEWASSADRQGIALAGTIIGAVITQPLVVIGSALLFFDLRARHSA